MGRDGQTGDTEPQALYNLGRLTGNSSEGSRAQGQSPKGQWLKADAAQRSRGDAPVGPATPPSLALRQLNGPGAPPCGQREEGTVTIQSSALAPWIVTALDSRYVFPFKLNGGKGCRHLQSQMEQE